MKKFFLAIVSLFVLSTTAIAGDGDFIYFAPKLSFGLSNYTGTVGSAFKGNISGGVAVGIDLPILGVIEGSVLYGTAGAKISDASDIYGVGSLASGEATVKSRYLYIPIVYKMYVLGGLHVYAGPQFDILLDEKLKYNDSTFSTEFLKDKTVSGVVGAGCDLGSFGIAFNYNFGFSSATVSSIASGIFENAKSPKNENMSIVFSYRF